LEPSNFGALAEILKETVTVHPRVHSVWADLMDAFFLVDGNSCAATIQDFWRTAVDEKLFNSTLERKFLGMKLFQDLLARLVQKSLPTSILYTPNFLSCLFNNLSNPGTNLHKAAKNAVGLSLCDLVFSMGGRKKLIHFWLSLPRFWTLQNKTVQWLFSLWHRPEEMVVQNR
jgi:hypothetical protein